MNYARIALCLIVAACGPSSRNSNGDDDGTNDAGMCTNGMPTCSADGTSVLDCSGNVVASCPADQGCANGACIDACDAAATNKSSIGCEYYAVDPDVISAGAGACFAAFIANTSSSAVSITVDRMGVDIPIAGIARIPSGAGQTLTYAALPGGMLQPDQVAILFLARFGTALTSCPSGVTPGFTSADAAVHGTGYGEAFHIKTSAPVVAYDIFPYGGGNGAATSATLLLPTSAWDTNYVGVDAYKQSVAAAPEAQPFMEIVAMSNATHVTVRPSAAIVAGPGVAAAAAGSTAMYTLAGGQVLQFAQPAELIGSAITADGPIGVWGGASCLNIDVNTGACDSAHQNVPPVKALGNRYVAVRYRNRFQGVEETVPWRLVGGVDGTTLTYSPSMPTGAPTTLGLGQLAEFNSAGQFIVQSQDADHPFYMSGYMTGACTLANANCATAIDPSDFDARGDPEYVNIIPPEQYLPKYTFFTDPTYPETNLVLVRENKMMGFADVTVDCVGTVTGWTPIDTADTMEYARVDLVTGNFAKVGNCNNGLHVASSTQPFGLVVWGWGSAATGGANLGDPTYSQFVSYAYPAGASVKPINTVVIE